MRARPASDSGARSSLWNVAFLSLLFCASCYYAWSQWSQYVATNASSIPTEAEAAPRADDVPAGGEVTPAPSATEAAPAPTRAPAPAPDGVAEPFVLSGWTNLSDGEEMPLPVGVGEDTAASIPELPRLSPGIVSQALIRRAEEVAREHPSVSWLRDYVVAAHLLGAGKEIRARRFAEALRYLDDVAEWDPPAGDVASFRAVIFGEQEEWEPAMRWAETALAYGSRANPSEMHHIIGKAHYYREEMAKAIESFNEALRIREDPRVKASLERAMREASAASGYENQRLAHFIVRYEGGTMEDTGRMVIDALDRSYATLITQLGFEPSERVVVVLQSREDYRIMGGPDWSLGSFDGKIRIPIRGLQRLDEHVKTTLHHELAHAFVHARGGRNVPRWLHEGIAEYVEGVRSDEHGELLARFINDGQSFEGCLSGARCDVRLFYPAASSMVDYMVQQRGLRGIREILTSLGGGTDINRALRDVMGQDEAGLIRGWEHFIRRRYS